MTVVLANHVDTLEFPKERGVSIRACREVLRKMAKQAQSDGHFKYGFRGVKVAEMSNYSLATVRRAQRYLVDHGFLERLTVGGGRRSTHWRLLLEKPQWNYSSRHNSNAGPTQPPGRYDTAQALPPVSNLGMDLEARPLPTQRNVKPWEVKPTLHSLINGALCEHGNPLGTTSEGKPKCPACRRVAAPPPLRQRTDEIMRRMAPKRPRI